MNAAEQRARYMEAIYGGRILAHYPLGSVKTAEQAKPADHLAVLVMRSRREAQLAHVTTKLSEISRDNLRNNSGYLRETNNVDGGPR